MKKVYMIGNTHFDPVWLWTWDEAMSSISATFRSALDRMEEYPEFIYSFSTPPVFEWIKKTSPEMFDEIKRRLAEGRWELAEGWWVQPDCMTPSGESLVRQGLYGQRYLMENFGRYSDTVFNIDSFGHPATLPQILEKSRIKNYVFCRPEGRHIHLDAPLFNWKSADGSSVLAYRDDLPYMDTAAAIKGAEECPYDSMKVYGVTDHGGAPTKKSIDEIRQSKNAACSMVSGFFEGRSTDYTVERELLTGDFGVYANNTGIKALNRRAEYALLNAEKTSVISDSDDRERLTKCWHDVLSDQFHDILGGACIKEAYSDARALYGRAISTANEITHYNLQRVTNQISMPGKNPDNAWNIVVWNLNAAVYDGYIEAEVQWAHEFPWYSGGIALEDGDGKRYECQIIRERSVIPGFRSRFLFKAQIPSVGYKAFKVIKTGEEVVRQTIDDPWHISTDIFDVTLSETGGIESVRDKSGKLIQGRLMCPVCHTDDGDTWAFNIKSYGDPLEAFKEEKFEVVETGELRTVVKSTLSFRSSKLEMYYSFYKKESYIDIRYRVNWNEKHIAFKLSSDLPENEHTASLPYGSVVRGESAADVPMGEWLRTDSFTVLSDHIFAYNVTDEDLGLTVLRSPIYGDLRISELDMDTDWEIMEQGINEGKMRICLSDTPDAPLSAMEFNNPPVVMCESNHGGNMAPCGSFLDCGAESVMLTVLKKTEDSDKTVIRGVEYSGSEQRIKLRLCGSEYETDVAPHEIFTLMIDGDSIRKVDMLEEGIEQQG